jgi:hypothetical protein
MLKLAVLALCTGLMLGMMPTAIAAGDARQSGRQGLFGTVSRVSADHPRAVAGETDITLDTASGPAEITATPGTVVRIPGWESATVESLAIGDPVAVLASGGQALSILVRTPLPVRTGHFSGVVTSLDNDGDDDGTIGIQDQGGDQLSAPALRDTPGLRLGELVTAVVEQDPRTGGLLITGLDRAVDSLDRIESALNRARQSNATAILALLRRRLAENSARHLTALEEASQKLEPSLRGGARQELESVLGSYASAFSRSNAGTPEAEATGIITAIDGPGRRVTVSPRGLELVEVDITGDTSIEIPGRQGRFDQLDLAGRVTVRYDFETRSASRVRVLLGETLRAGPAGALLSIVQRGEITGAITGLDAEAGSTIVTIRNQASGNTKELTVSEGSVITDGGNLVEVSTLAGAVVAVSFDPGSSSVIELDTHTLQPSEATVTGVLQSFVPKTMPGNISVLSPDGVSRAFNRTEDTVIRRDGRRVTISQVRLGDLVRPNTRYQTGPEGSGGPEGDLVLLSLRSVRSTPVHGTIRGVTLAPGGETRVTLTNRWLELVSLLVTGGTELFSQGKAVAPGDLAEGQRVLSGAYDPISTEAVRLVLGPPKALQVQGEITEVDENLFAITIAPRRGDPVRLFVLESTPVRIVLQRSPDARFSDLRAGQRVRAGFYDASSMEALRLVIN